MIILSIETSCDETAAAIVKFKNGKAEVLANVVSSQIKTHSKFGGVVPSLASRMHLKNMVPVLKRAFTRAKINKNKIDYIAVTNGPGLIPALMVGTQAAKALAYALNKPLIPVHHIEGHIYANWLKPVRKCQMSNVKCQNYTLANPEFPVLCLIVSGGHTQLVLMKKDLDYKIIGETLDDAAGEAFDKVAKLLGVGYPGGPVIEKMARLGNKNKFKFPRPMMNSKDYNFSFSGLKTAVLYAWNLEFRILNLEDRKKNVKLQNSGADFNSAKFHPDFRQDSKFKIQNSKFKFDIAASFQQAVIDVLISKTIRAAKEYKVKNIILGGGVSANKELQKQFKERISKEFPITNSQLPITNLSTDNALMIAVAGYYYILNNKNISDWKNVEADANLVLSI
ncbi:tRNA (adenosine(37)-N6)-threonylcarbamoyltransferase complex transferase subunit TsaD [Patescibacteria group bacterium]|nr:tRNA (adenosine(37)-N6)-threonylcarbamoyltransferase complex transferase subunit TsaD [Patescibacteria group bacterium]